MNQKWTESGSEVDRIRVRSGQNPGQVWTLAKVVHTMLAGGMVDATEALEHLVTKSNQLVEASYRLSVAEQRIVALLVSKVAPADEDFKPYTFTVAELAELVGLEGKHLHEQLQAATRTLIDRVVSIRNGNKLTQVSWMSSATYEEGAGRVSLCFDPAMKPHLLRLKECFTSYRLKHVVKLRSTYSVRLYELLIQYATRGERAFKLDELREVLAIEKGSYANWRDFKKRILEPARLELSEHTDMVMQYEQNTGPRGRVLGVVFKFKLKTAKTESLKRRVRNTSKSAARKLERLRAEAQRCFIGCAGSCQGIWSRYESTPTHVCHWCEKFEQRRLEANGQNRLPGL